MFLIKDLAKIKLLSVKKKLNKFSLNQVPSFHYIISGPPFSQNFKYMPGHFFKEMQYVKMFLKRKFETLRDCETPVSKFKTETQKNSRL